MMINLALLANSLIANTADTTHMIVDTLLRADSVKAVHAAAESGAPELPNWLELAKELFPGKLTEFLFHWQTVIFSVFVWVALSIICIIAYKKRSIYPGKLQNVLEWAVESISNMITGISGEHGKKYVPFLGTLFIYILTMNLLGLFPGMYSSTSKLNTTLALALCVFLYVQLEGIRNLGILGYLFHLAGSPRSTVEWCLVPLNLPLHIIGELAKPISLSLRLFGNISGEDMLLAIFVGLGISSLSFLHPPSWLPGLPLQFPFIFLALLTSFVQAMVFTMLSAIYFSLMSHEETEEEHH
jgi:F-type H+-transporting ATPase subunit a